MGVTDLQVLQAFKKGQLELFYRRIYPGLLLYAVKNAGDRHDFLAEDYTRQKKHENKKMSGPVTVY